MIYLDTSAFLKLVWRERCRDELEALLAGHQGPRVSSSLLAVEARRAALRLDPTALPHIELLLTRVGLVTITSTVLEIAGRLPDPHLRSLDAIHLATAMQLGGDLDALVTYDKCLAVAAGNARLTVVAPGQ